MGIPTNIGLVVTGTMVFFHFPETVGNFIIPTDELTPSFFRGVGLNQPDMAISAVSWDSNLHFFPLMVLGEV